MSKAMFRVFWLVCFIVYLALLIKWIVFKYPDTMMSEILYSWTTDRLLRHISTANIIPFKTISASLFHSQLRVEVLTLIYNILAFLPVGFILPCLSEKIRTLSLLLLVGFMISCALELIQLVTMLGAADIDDVILNVIGTGIGYGVFKLATTTYQTLTQPPAH